MNRKILWFLLSIALVLGVAFPNYGKKDEPSVLSMNGTYEGAFIVMTHGVDGDEEFDQDFTIATTGGKTTLSITLNVPVEMPADTQNISLPLEVELKDFTPVTDAKVNATVGDNPGEVPFTGILFNVADFSSTILVLGGTITLKEIGSLICGSKKYHGAYGTFKEKEESEIIAIIVLSGTVSGGIFPQTQPILIAVGGQKK